MSSLKKTLFGPLLASLFLGGIAMAGTKPKEPPAGYVYQYVYGRSHLERRLVPINKNPGSYVISQETGRSVAGPGDYWAYRSVGRRQVRVWVHDLVVNPAGRNQSGLCSDCSHRYVSVGHHAEWQDSCMVDGRRVDCSKTPAECPECAREMERRMDHCGDEVRP